MSEVQPRSPAPAPRGRGAGRAGRGGYNGRNEGRFGNPRRVNGDKSTASSEPTPVDNDHDLAHLRKLHGDKTDLIKEMFPGWSEADVLYALQETDGDIQIAATRISEGSISQWGEVSKAKKTSKAKPSKEATVGPNEVSGSTRPTRGGREGRGGRGPRGYERGRGARGRGYSSFVHSTNGHHLKENTDLSIPTDDDWGNAISVTEAGNHAGARENPWGTATENTGGGTADNTGDNHEHTCGNSAAMETPAVDTAGVDKSTASEGTRTQESPSLVSAPAQETVPIKPKTWASMLRQATIPKPALKPKAAPAPKPAEKPIEPLPAAESAVESEQPSPEEAKVEEPIAGSPAAPAPGQPETPLTAATLEDSLPPPDSELTEDNVAHLPDASKTVGSATAASTAADSWDPRVAAQQSATATPISASQAQHQPPRVGIPSSGYAATAIKATERSVRVPSYQRRLLEQEEAVRMPGNREVDRTAVQFGAFNLNGTDDDIDGDREDAETRAQPPLDSPIQPRASLPPVTHAAAVSESYPSAATPTQVAHNSVTALPQLPGTVANPVGPPAGPAAAGSHGHIHPAPAPMNNQQYGRFGPAATHEQPFLAQKPYDSYAQQNPVTTATGFDSYTASATQASTQPGGVAFSSAPGDYSSYYTSEPQSRNSYGNYYGQQYGQGGQNQEGPGQSRSFGGGYNASQSNDNLAQYPQSGAQQSRFGAVAQQDVHNSGPNTPIPPVGQSQQPQQQAGQNNGPQATVHQQPPANNYPYGHPYYTSPFYAQTQYMGSGYGGGYGQGAGYGAAPYGKGAGGYGQPHQYGAMSHQPPYDHTPSAGTGAFGQAALGRDSGIGSTVDSYGRAGTGQNAQSGLGNSAYGNHDTFGRATSSYQSQATQYHAPNTQGSGNDELKPYGDSKSTGPSPSLVASARPGSANHTPGQSGLPPPQSGQQGMGGYGGYGSHVPSQGLHGSQAANSGYGSAGQSHGPYSGGYGGYAGNQPFGGNYGGRQQQGWGNNY